MDWSPVVLTFKLAFVTTCCLLLLGIPLAYWLAFSKMKYKTLIETLVSMPLVLPPSVLGFYLLLAFSPNSGIGKWLAQVLGFQLVFSFEGLVLASILYSLPFMVQPIQAGFKNLPLTLREAAYTIGKSPFQTLLKVLLPNMRPAIFSGVVLAFAHTIGEFGVVLMIGGNIPHETRVASIAVYDAVESLNYEAANQYAFVLFATTFSILFLFYLLNKEDRKYDWFRFAKNIEYRRRED
ncbi:MAG: molybdate ABC transporter permease subunit [Saprospiraceae bacterium]|nr:molybdate ABC transporter permease subunit [Saprospiraceae bacterium]